MAEGRKATCLECTLIVVSTLALQIYTSHLSFIVAWKQKMLIGNCFAHFLYWFEYTSNPGKEKKSSSRFWKIPFLMFLPYKAWSRKEAKLLMEVPLDVMKTFKKSLNFLLHTQFKKKVFLVFKYVRSFQKEGENSHFYQ